MILEAILFFGLFHHKHKPAPRPTLEQQAFAKLVDEDHKIILDAITGAQAFEEDTQFAKFERPEIDAFEHQIFTCITDTDDHQMDKDVDVLIDLGKAMMALDQQLHKEYVI